MPAPAEGGATVASLPNDAIFEILSRTPTKSVCRFRCVSRGWCALVSDPVFVAAHESRSEPHLLLIANSSNKESGSQGRDLRLIDMHRSTVKVIKEVGINSAFCPNFEDTICVTFEDGCYRNVVDLATGKVLATSRDLLDGFGFRCPYTFGFGRAILSGAYKAVRIKHPDVGGQSRCTCEVLTLAEGAAGAEWRQTRSDPPFPVSGGFATTVNGVLHFLCRSADGVYVLRFDLESEDWKKKAIRGPQHADGDGDGMWWNITQLNGTLCMIGYRRRVRGRTRTTIWRMTDYDREIWTEAYTISTAPNVGQMMPLRVIGGDKLLVCWYRNYGLETTLQIYDPCTETFTFAMEMPYTTVGVVGLCSLHLKGFWMP